MLGKLVLEKMRERGLSARAVARECGVAHTTVNRLLDNKPVDLDTIERFSNWLGVDMATVFGSTEGDLANQISILIQMEPELGSVFGKAIDGVLNGTYSRRDIEDIVAYATFRLQPTRGVNDNIGTTEGNRQHHGEETKTPEK